MSINSSVSGLRTTQDSRPGSRCEFTFRLCKHTNRNNGYGERILSDSNHLHLTHDRQNEGRTSPTSDFYHPHNPPLDEYLKLSLKNTRKELKSKLDQMKSSKNVSDFIFKQQNEKLLMKEKKLKQLLHNYYSNNPTSEAKKNQISYKPPFSSSGKREFQKTPRLDRDRKDVPHFFKSEQDWNFGNGSRTTSMSFDQLPNLMHDSIISINSRVNSPSTNSKEGSLESKSSSRRGLGGGQLGQGLRLSPILVTNRKH